MTDQIQAPPHDREIERALVGAALLAPAMLEDPQVAQVQPAHFYERRLGKIWSAIQHLAGEDKGVDALTVGHILDHRGELEDVGDIIFLSQLEANCPGSHNAATYAEIVISKAAARRLWIVAGETAKLAFSANGDYPGALLFAEAHQLIDAAMEGIPQPQRERWTAAELAALQIPESPYLVPGLIIEGGLNLIAGEFGAGKSFLCQDLAIAAATGGMAWGQAVEPCGVLYFGADNSRSNMIRRIRELTKGRGIDPPHEALTVDLSPIDLAQPSGMAVIKGAIQETGARLVIVDAMIRYMGGLDENIAGDVAPLMARFRELTLRTGATLVLVHHLAKVSGQLSKRRLADRIRGSGDFLGAADSAIVLTVKGEAPNLVRHLAHVKNREDEESDPLTFAIMDGEDGGTVLTFEAGNAAAMANTLAELAAGAMLERLRSNAGSQFTTSALKECVGAMGLKVSDRTFKAATKQIQAISAVVVSKQGRTNVYSWSEMDVESG